MYVIVIGFPFQADFFIINSFYELALFVLRFSFSFSKLVQGGRGAVVVTIVWQLDLQLPIQSVPITTKVMSSNNNWFKNNFEYFNHQEKYKYV